MKLFKLFKGRIVYILGYIWPIFHSTIPNFVDFCCNRWLREFYKVRWKNILPNVPNEHFRNGTVWHPFLGHRKTLAKISCKILLISWVTSARHCSAVANDHWSTNLLDKLRSPHWLVLASRVWGRGACHYLAVQGNRSNLGNPGLTWLYCLRPAILWKQQCKLVWLEAILRCVLLLLFFERACCCGVGGEWISRNNLCAETKCRRSGVRPSWIELGVSGSVK